MDRLFRHRQSGTPADEHPELEPIRVYAHDVEVGGWISTHGERVTDLLRGPSGLPILLEGADPANPDSWLELNSSEVLMVVPPPHVSPPEKRLHRQTQQVVIRIGPYLVTGTAYLRPGYDQDLFLRATQPFLPLTDAVVASQAGQTQFDVVIVNLAEVEELREA